MGSTTDEDIKVENNLSDASYREKENSLAPAAMGGFQGGLASGLVSRVAKPKRRLHEALIIGGGTAVGATAGQLNHKDKIKDKRKARASLTKTSEEDGSLGMDVGLGGGLGGIIGAATSPKGKSRGKWGTMGAITGALSGGVSNRASAAVEGEEKNTNMAAVLGVGAAAEGALSQSANKFVGRHILNPVKDRESIVATRADVINHHRNKGILNRASRILGFMDDDKSILEGVKMKEGQKFFDKKLMARSGWGGLRQGIVGAGIGHLIDRAGSPKEK